MQSLAPERQVNLKPSQVATRHVRYASVLKFRVAPLLGCGSAVVLRCGGSWSEDPEVARSAGRNGGTPDRRSYLMGLRCAKSVLGERLEAKGAREETLHPLPRAVSL